MSNVGNNIKKLRKVKGLSQQAFGDVFNLTRGNISSYEEMRAEPKIEIVLKIANYFGIPVQHLIEKNLSVNEILNFNDYFQPDIPTLGGKRLSQVPLLEREVLLDACTYVSKLNELPVIEFPLQSRNRFIAMEYMDAIPVPGDFVITAQSILFFEEIDIESLHTLNNAFGLCFSAEEFFIGKYTMVEREISLVLNAWKKVDFVLAEKGNFWKLYGKFERI
ncbi:helix-turn-helix domain-containing protein [Sphingobacterium detergens]|uniref:DNA-binding XRE family transcriptional regulator n=1 Tax=Sphingobacterium detergens TaxID=1145106 RepID=A0A420AG58_SPHD1|nr:helix-turn-helix transcriptional regulator [Sphingobacterium detergens]RKE43403.1 DNA-binding XRE family transcriptional regulator [Sphingobacterium detergens]